MEIGKGCESKPFLHEGASERECLPRDTLQPPFSNPCNYIQENSHSLVRTRAKSRSRVNKHIVARGRHSIMVEVTMSVRRE